MRKETILELDSAIPPHRGNGSGREDTHAKLPARRAGKAFTKGDHSIKWIPVKQLIVKWESAQRKMEGEDRAIAIAEAFDPELFGVLTVAQADENDMHHVIDGNHRKTAVDLLFGSDERVPCEVLSVTDAKRAAQIFIGRNRKRRPVSHIDTHNVSVEAGIEPETSIDRIIRRLGYRVGSGQSDGLITAPGALKSVYRRFGPDVLSSALHIIQATWGKDQNAVSAPIIQGYGMLLGEYGKKVNWGRLKANVAKRFTPGRLIGAARSIRDVERGSVNDAVKRVLLATYNRGLKMERLGE